jgi:quercetin 2,3-dioxygenase
VILTYEERQMIEIRPFASLGHADHGWLDARHHFSFASYRDPARMGWGNIRVWNDDSIAAGTGFDPHPHNDMEIVTFVRTGAITHRDSLGNEGRTAAGDVQVMSAGTGIVHSEHNRESETTTLFQIWILPDSRGQSPSWGQREFPRRDRAGQWEIVASGDPENSSTLPLRANARVMAANLEAGQSSSVKLDPSRHIYLVAASGTILVNGVQANPRDGVAITGEAELVVEAVTAAEVVLADSI